MPVSRVRQLMTGTSGRTYESNIVSSFSFTTAMRAGDRSLKYILYIKIQVEQ